MTKITVTWLNFLFHFYGNSNLTAFQYSDLCLKFLNTELLHSAIKSSAIDLLFLFTFDGIPNPCLRITAVQKLAAQNPVFLLQS